MGTVYNRGTRSKPNWYIAYKDEKGRRRSIPSGQRTKALAQVMLGEVEAKVCRLKLGLETVRQEHNFGELFEGWVASLRNRSAKDDRSRARKHLLPRFGEGNLSDITLHVLMRWIDEQRAAGKLAEATIRHNLNLLSRFFGWAIERGYAEVNPVRQIPTGKRPKQSAKKHVPWLSDGALVLRMLRELPDPLHFMFYLGNRSGLRSGEIVGLRLSDLTFLDEQLIRVRYSGDGPLKEDKNEEGKTKWVPAADDAKAFLTPLIDRRRAEGAGPEDYVFPCERKPTTYYRPLQIRRNWEEIRGKFGQTLTWYQATRHTFASRCLANGASLDEVSAALGHSSPTVTRRFYDHYIRKTFSPLLHKGLGLDGGSSEPAASQAPAPAVPAVEHPAAEPRVPAELAAQDRVPTPPAAQDRVPTPPAAQPRVPTPPAAQPRPLAPPPRVSRDNQPDRYA